VKTLIYFVKKLFDSTKMSSEFPLRLFIVILIISFSGYSYSQRTLINPISWGQFDIPSGKEDLLDSILANPLYDTIIPVEVDYLPEIQSHGLLEFTLPTIEDPLYAFVEQVRSYSSDNFVWRGRETNSVEDMMIIEEDDMVYGYFFVDSATTFELIDLGTHHNILVKFSEIFNDTTGVECAVEAAEIDPIRPPGENSSHREGCDDAKPVRILVLYSEGAAKVILPGQKARIFIEQMNMGLENSDIKDDEVRVQLAGVLPLPAWANWEETINIGDDLYSYRELVPLGPDFPTSVKDMRDDPGADLVVLFTNGNYDNCRTLGNAIQSDWTKIGNGFSIVEGDGALRYTFAHEVGHNFGCRHQLDHDTLPYNANGYFWKHHKKRSTIMVTGGSGKSTRILHYSNPDVSFDGHVTGSEEYQDNASQLRNANDAVADNFEYCDDNMYAWISGPSKGDENTLYEWCANTINCDDVDNYHWELSTDGFTFTNYANNSYTDCINIYLPTGSDLVIRLTVLCSDNQEFTNFIHVINDDNNAHYATSKNPYNDALTGEVFGSVNISPNPASGNVSIRFILRKSGNVSIFKSDLLGSKEPVFSGYLESGSQTVEDQSMKSPNSLVSYTIESNGIKESRMVVFKQN
jgi:hypothetical protein